MANFSLQRDRLRVVFGRNPPDAFVSCRKFPTLNPSVDCPYVGFTTEIISMLVDASHFYLEPVVISSDVGGVNWGTYVNNSFNGVLGMIEQFKADTACILFQYVEERDVYFDYSDAITYIRTVYITKPKTKNVGMALWNAFKPYQPTVWLCLLMALCLQCGFASLCAKAEYRFGLEEKFMPFYKSWQYLRLQVHQSMDLFTPFRLSSGNFNFMFYSLVQATLFTNLYSGILLFALIHGEDLRPWDSFDAMTNLVKNGDYKFVIDRFNYEGNWFFKEIVRSNTPHTKKIFDALQKNSVLVTETIEEAFEIVDRGQGHIFPTQEDSHAYFVSKERCNYYYSHDEQLVKAAYFLFSDKNPLLKRWNLAIKFNGAFIRRTFQKYFESGFLIGKIPRCPKTDNDISEASKPLNVMSTFGIFLVLIIGLSLAGLVFILEWIFKFVYLKIRSLPRSKEKRHLADPWTALNKARTFYIQQRPTPIFIINQKPLIPKWWQVITSMGKEKCF